MPELVKEDTQLLTRNGIVEKLKDQYIPKKYLINIFNDNNITAEEANEINKILECSSQEAYQELLALAIEHKEILKYDYCPDIVSYIRALKFISYINIGKSFVEAYVGANSNNTKVMAAYLDDNKAVKESLKANAIMYAKSKLVIKLQQVLDFPLHLHFGGYRFQAIDVLKHEMEQAPLSKDRIQAADRLLAHLTPIMEQNNNLIINNINTGEKNIVDTYKEALEMFANSKIKMLQENNTLDAKEVLNLSTAKEQEDE